MFCSKKIFLKCLLKSERLIGVIEHKIIASIEILAFKIGPKIMLKAVESRNKFYVSFPSSFSFVIEAGINSEAPFLQKSKPLKKKVPIHQKSRGGGVN